MTNFKTALFLFFCICQIKNNALAQSFESGSGDMRNYLRERTVLVRMSCKPNVEKIDDVDVGSIAVRQRVSWGSGAIIRNDGMIVTTYHTLGELLEKERKQAPSGFYDLVCDEDDVDISFYRTENIQEAARDQAGEYAENPSSRDDDRRRNDVLFLQAETLGNRNLPYICRPSSEMSRDEFDDLPIHIAGIKALSSGQRLFDYEDDGKATDELGEGTASNFLIMDDAPAEPGASGGPVIDDHGVLMGIVHGYSKAINPQGIDNYLIPVYLFDNLLKDYGIKCGSKPVEINWKEINVRATLDIVNMDNTIDGLEGSIKEIISKYFDQDGDGEISTVDEVIEINCNVLKAINKTLLDSKNGYGLDVYGFESDDIYFGSELGFDDDIRIETRIQMIKCGIEV